MSQTYRLNWKGDDLKGKMAKAAIDGIDETMAAAVTAAKRLTPVRTGALQGSIRFVPARRAGDMVYGIWGSFNILYAVYVELGTYRMRGRFMFRQASEQEYPKLRARISKRFGALI